ncbi:MAG: hypothetical protein ABI836_06540 [Gemmatimonadota bacterium]
MSLKTSLAQAMLSLTFLLGLGVSAGNAQSKRDEQTYYPGGFNWQFLAVYPEAARLFNAFDYGHAVLYERLYTTRGQAQRELEKEYAYLTTDLLIRPPRFAIAEEVIEPTYAKIAWRAKLMFDWAHMLHRQIYDVYADERLTPVQRDSMIERLTDYYLSNRKYAFSDHPKSMALMDEQPFSQTFRKAYPKFNGLIWSYHWLQVGLYEPLIEGQTRSEKKAGVQATVARFWSMLEDAPNRFPRFMPMTSAIAPRFSAAHPRAAVIFDNLHMTHDIISDILVSERIPYADKGRIIEQQLDMLQDSTKDVISMDEWRMMAEHMGGAAAMGGPATGLLRPVQTGGMPASEGGLMQHDMPGMRTDSGARHDMGTMDHPMANMVKDTTPTAPGDTTTVHHNAMTTMMEMHQRMMQDPIIRRRVLADSALRRMMEDMMRDMPAEHRARMEEMMRSAPPHPAKPAPDSQPGHHQHSSDSSGTQHPRPN